MTDRAPVANAADASTRSEELYAKYSPRTAEQVTPFNVDNESNWGPAPF